ncbi:MAG: L,D-transpeptidase family protein [Sedimentisphaerales bacterium]
MARFPSSSYVRRKGRNLRWVYSISALFIIAVVISFIYGYPFGKNEEGTSARLVDVKVENEIKPLPVVAPNTIPKRTVESKITPKITVETKTPAIIPEPTTESNPKVTELIDEAMLLVKATPSKVIEARDRLNEAFSMPMNNVQRAVIKRKLSELADKWLFSRTVYPQDRFCSNYQVKPGDLLRSISNDHKVPWEILQEVNNISRPELLRAGQMIKIIHGPFHAKVYLSTFTMDVYLQNTFVRSFRVGLGQEGKETPTGLWSVKQGGKLIKPPWSDPETGKLLHYGDPGYALGSRWIALDGLGGNAKGRTGFGIHGTIEPETIGTKSSKGCIRLHNGDVKKVYNMLTEVQSLVRVID